jgi:NAD(P)-dependent dehydrogenase (short-subunit alcohol dehydrogenase family)
VPWSTTDVPDLADRVAVVTGANSGLGLETTRELARRGAHVLMAVRDGARAEAASADVEASVPEASLELVPLDLADLGSVTDAARRLTTDHPRIDLLVANAGVMATPERRTQDGFELQVGINHLGHFALVAQLMPSLARAVAARVVTVTSTGRHLGRVLDPRDPWREGRYDPWRAYGDSKLANLLFAVELDVRLRAAGARVASLAAHPGLSATELQARSVHASGGGRTQRLAQRLAHGTGSAPELAVLPQLRAATDPDADGGQLYAPRFVNVGPPVRRPLLARSRSRRAGRRSWRVSELQTGLRFDVAETVALAS